MPWLVNDQVQFGGLGILLCSLWSMVVVSLLCGTMLSTSRLYRIILCFCIKSRFSGFW